MCRPTPSPRDSQGHAARPPARSSPPGESPPSARLQLQARSVGSRLNGLATLVLDRKRGSSCDAPDPGPARNFESRGTLAAKATYITEHWRERAPAARQNRIAGCPGSRKRRDRSSCATRPQSLATVLIMMSKASSSAIWREGLGTRLLDSEPERCLLKWLSPNLVSKSPLRLAAWQLWPMQLAFESDERVRATVT